MRAFNLRKGWLRSLARRICIICASPASSQLGAVCSQIGKPSGKWTGTNRGNREQKKGRQRECQSNCRRRAHDDEVAAHGTKSAATDDESVRRIDRRSDQAAADSLEQWLIHPASAEAMNSSAEAVLPGRIHRRKRRHDASAHPLLPPRNIWFESHMI